MSKTLSLIKEPNLKLHQKSEPVKDFDAELKDFMQSLLKIMYQEEGIGIASIQVGHPIRALIVDIPVEDKTTTDVDKGKTVPEVRKPYYIINPKILSVSNNKIVLEEGCLSVRKEDGIEFVRGKVERPESITIDYQDLDGVHHILEVNGSKSEYDKWFSRCLQHEYDHLEGILFTEKLYNTTEIIEIN